MNVIVFLYEEAFEAVLVEVAAPCAVVGIVPANAVQENSCVPFPL
jgi:hypothetical protein